MLKFVIEREIPKIGASSPEQYQGIAGQSCAVLEEMGPPSSGDTATWWRTRPTASASRPTPTPSVNTRPKLASPPTAFPRCGRSSTRRRGRGEAARPARFRKIWQVY